MKKAAIVINVALIVLLSLVFFANLDIEDYAGTVFKYRAIFIIITISGLTLYYLYKGNRIVLRNIIVVLNVIIGALIYIPITMYIFSPDGNNSIVTPIIAVTASLPFMINVIALIKVEQ